MTSIMHISIPADDPAHTALVLADIMNGEAVRFPPGGSNGWKVFSGDGAIDLEIIQRGEAIVWQEGVDEGAFQQLPVPQRSSECHLALCVDRPEVEVIEIARNAGWPARHCERGGGLFGLAEVWIDGTFMVEVLDPVESARYRQSVTAEKLKAYLPVMLKRHQETQAHHG